MKRFLILVITAPLLIGCGQQEGPAVTQPETVASAPAFEVIDVEADEAFSLVESGDIAVLDVRTLAEWDSGYIANAVRCDISDPEFEKNLAKIEHNKPYVVH